MIGKPPCKTYFFKISKNHRYPKIDDIICDKTPDIYIKFSILL